MNAPQDGNLKLDEDNYGLYGLGNDYPKWTQTQPVPEGYYKSLMYPSMVFRRREAGSVIPPDIAVRYAPRSVIDSEVTTQPLAAEAKKLASEDAARYGAAAAARKLMEYFEWRATVGLSWWLEQERLYPPADNDNDPDGIEAAA
jgi:hypothetical protein